MLTVIFVLLIADPITSLSQRLPSVRFESNYKRNPLIITGVSDSQNTNEYHNAESQSTAGLRRSRDENQKTFKIILNEEPSHNSQYINSFGGYSQKRRQHPSKTNIGPNYHRKGSLRTLNTLFSDCNATSNTIVIRKSGWNRAPTYLPPLYETTTVYKAQEYLPPRDRRPIVTPTKQPNITTRRPYYTRNKVTKKPLYTWTSTETIQNMMTTIPYYSYIPTVKHITTKGPYYIPVTKPPVSTYHATQKNNNDAKMTEYDPANAMRVPFEDDETAIVVPVAKTEKPRDRSTGFADVNVVLKQTTPKMMRPIDRVGSERGDVPDDYEDSTITTTPISGKPAPAIAKPVPTEPEDETPITTKMVSTVASTITSETTSSLSSTTNQIQTMTTLQNSRHLIEESSTTPNNKLQTTTVVPFKGSEYIPPKTSSTETPSVITASPAPALAMNVPTEPEDVPSLPPPPSTTPTTISTASIITTITTKNENNRHLMEKEASTTLIKKIKTTAITPFKGREYLPPKDKTRIPSTVTASSDEGPAMAMDVPPEPEDLQTVPSASTTSTNTFRAAETSTTTIPDVSSFKAPEYLPPTTEPSPLPAIAMKVPPEPECDLDSDNPKIDPRSFIDESCMQNTPKPTVPSYKGPPYLPPLIKTRLQRSLNRTLSLSDLEGTPRPVWYAGVYRRTTEPPFPICGGSIVREDVVISAAHCFWEDKDGLQSADLFTVAARKIYKRYNHPMDKRAQKSDVVSIQIPPRFLGAKTSFQDDIAVLKLVTPFTFTPSVSGLRPICVDFDVEFDRQQMKDGHMGTVAGWGYTDASGTGTKVLLWLELPYVEIEKCIQNSEQTFLKYITCDKVCAGENDTGKALCRGDSGGGLAFWQGSPTRATPYLRGVASTAPSRRNAECNVFAYGSFTHIRAHRTFLRDHVPDIEECRFWTE